MDTPLRFGWTRYLLVAMVSISLVFMAVEVSAQTEKPFTYDDYAAVLSSYVDNNGAVSYREMQAHRETLDAFVLAMERLDENEFTTWTDSEKIAFWINAYNALTLRAIVDNYPINPSFLGSFRFPKNSIRQISGVWDELKFSVMGEQLTLDEIEHSILRREFREPRIHFALVCAAKGCPPLRNEPYIGERLDDQLNDQARRFLNNPEKFKIDPEAGRVYLSSIFEWFGDDFVPEFGSDELFEGHSKAERAVLNFCTAYLGEQDVRYLLDAKYDILYLHYDWSLNEKAGQ